MDNRIVQARVGNARRGLELKRWVGIRRREGFVREPSLQVATTRQSWSCQYAHAHPCTGREVDGGLAQSG